jgi:hypothetical protein
MLPLNLWSIARLTAAEYRDPLRQLVGLDVLSARYDLLDETDSGGSRQVTAAAATSVCGWLHAINGQNSSSSLSQ